MSSNKDSFLQYLPLFWPVRQLRAAVPNLSLSQNTPISWYTYCYTYIHTWICILRCINRVRVFKFWVYSDNNTHCPLRLRWQCYQSRDLNFDFFVKPKLTQNTLQFIQPICPIGQNIWEMLEKRPYQVSVVRVLGHETWLISLVNVLKWHWNTQMTISWLMVNWVKKGFHLSVYSKKMKTHTYM